MTTAASWIVTNRQEWVIPPVSLPTDSAYAPLAVVFVPYLGMVGLAFGPSTIVDVGSLLVVTGPPGAGKSAVAETLAGSTSHGVLIEGDAFFGFLASGAIEP